MNMIIMVISFLIDSMLIVHHPVYVIHYRSALATSPAAFTCLSSGYLHFITWLKAFGSCDNE